ncbi:MAG: DUF6624 domain-containing protein [Pseudoxanthomonas sp.]
MTPTQQGGDAWRVRRLPGCALLAFALVVGTAHADETVRRSSIFVSAGGKQVAAIVLPLGVDAKLDIAALRIEKTASGGLHASGNVQARVTWQGSGPVTLFGDDFTMQREALPPEHVQAIRDLEAMGKSDQAVRGQPNPEKRTAAEWRRQEAIDAANMARLAQIIDRHGWPGVRFAGYEGASNAFLVLQHAELDSQRKYLPLMREAVQRHDALGNHLALLEDRVRMREGKPQIYGSQLVGNPPALVPIEDEANVDQRRRAVGLGPLAEYLKLFGLTYRPK